MSLIVAKMRGTDRTVVVLGTTSLYEALAAAGMSKTTHKWGGSYVMEEGWTLHKDGSASYNRGPRPGVMFGNVYEGEMPV